LAAEATNLQETRDCIAKSIVEVEKLWEPVAAAK